MPPNPPQLNTQQELLTYLRQELGYCGCGYYEEALRTLRDILQLASDRQNATGDLTQLATTTRTLNAWATESPGPTTWFIWLLDKHNFIWHGHNTSDIWITEKGQTVLNAIKAHYPFDDEQPEPIPETEPPAFPIRPEVPDDYNSVNALVVEAFQQSDHGHNGEAELVTQLRNSSPNRLSLIACSDDQIVGHILFTPAILKTTTQEIQGMGLAPLSVAPAFQRQGIGSALIQQGLTQLFATDCAFVIVLGHPDYYTRFGFLPASGFGVSHGFADIPQEPFFFKLNPSISIKSIAGKAYYHPEFGPQHCDA